METTAWVGVSVAVAASSIVLAGATPARACSYGLGLEVMEPANGATDVPTNVVPWLRGAVGSDGVTGATGTPSFGDGGIEGIAVTLKDELGADVPFELEVHSAFPYRDTVEVWPMEPLTPRTTYTLAVSGEGGAGAHSFTTGDGPLEATPPTLEPAMQVADRSTVDTACELNSYACVSIPNDTTVYAEVTTDDGVVEGELIWGGVPSDFEWIRRAKAVDSPFCVELSARAITGELGPPSTVCSTAARRFSVEEAEHAVQCDGARIRVGDGYLDERSEGGGCSAAGTSPGPWLALAAVGLLAAGRRGRYRE